ncbi:MAG: hypothetical protein JST68_16720 [Bacteroidetes bacterium]|nr:hypothetical protein [Bacteroidota bacterium]
MKRILSFGLFALIVVALTFSTSSCKKTVTVIVKDTVRSAWQLLPLYNSNGMAALNSWNAGDTSLFIVGNFGITQVPVNRSAFNNFFTWPLPGSSYIAPVYVTPFYDGKVCSYMTPEGFYAYGVPQATQYSTISYNPVMTPGTYSRLSQNYVFGSQSSPAADYPVIRDRYALMPVETVGTSNAETRFDLIRWDSAQLLSPFTGPQTPVVKSIVVSAAVGLFTLSNYYCAAYYDKFFVSYGGQFFRVDTLGNVKAFGPTPVPGQRVWGIANMFTYSGMLFINSGGLIYFSSDQGENWSVWNDFTNSSASRVIFRNVGKDLYATMATLSSQLWKVVIDGRNLNFSELNTDGFASSLMTSITRCGKYVFITTPTGVYYRDSTYFNQLTKPVR